MFPLSDQAGTPAAPTPEPRQRPRRNPGSAHAAPVEPTADQPKKGKAADPVRKSAALSKSQTLAGKS